MEELSAIVDTMKQKTEGEIESAVRNMLERNSGNYPLLRQAASLLGADYERSAAVLKQLLHFSPNDFEVHLDLAGLYWLMGEDELVEVHCNAALALNPNLAKAYGLLAFVYQSRGETAEKVESAFKRAEILEPDKWFRHSNLAHFYRESGQVQEAAAEIRKALSCSDLPADDRNRLEAELIELDRALNS